MFLDEAIISVHGGRGGRGTVSWRREKYIPKGGPDGGNGGKGGGVIFQANDDTDTLTNFSSRKVFTSENGENGGDRNKTGKSGEDLVLKVPPGTLIIDQKTNQILADLQKDGDQVLIAKGGRGGYGNAHFKSATRQKPDFSELGEPGDELQLKLELKLVADVGIIGYPSVGKSTLISVISAAKPKIADYPFTTLIPNLGVVMVNDRSYVVCDVPGLIEGASEGKGLGGQFLKHIERCGILVHVLDISRALVDGKLEVQNLVNDYKTIRTELENYSDHLMQKKELVILNKTDLTSEDIDALTSQLKKEGIEIFMSLSAATHSRTQDLVTKLLPLVLKSREERAAKVVEEEIAVLQPHVDEHRMGAYRFETDSDNSIHIYGTRIEQFTKMTDFLNEGAVRRFRDVIERTGIVRAIKKVRKSEDTAVYIGNQQIDEFL